MKLCAVAMLVRWLFLAVLVCAEEKNLYDVLGIPMDAPREEIRRAYRRKALEWHPDKNPSPDAEERFREIGRAYEILYDDERRAHYDNGPSNGFDGLNFNFDFGDPFDIFKNFFGGFFGGENPSKMFGNVFEEMDHFNPFEDFPSGSDPFKNVFQNLFMDDAFKVFGGPSPAPSHPSNPHCEHIGPDGRCFSHEFKMCKEFEVQANREPQDNAVDHVKGSACCNSAPLLSSTNRDECCSRCLQNERCDMFVWQPSSGMCWLLRWKVATRHRSTSLSHDRIFGELLRRSK